MAKVSRPIVYTGLFAVVVFALVWAFEEPDARGGAQLAQRTARSSADTEDNALQADLEAEFPPLQEPVSNAFRPLVVSANGPSASAADAPTNDVPASFADGESGWAYTGTSVLDGVPLALVENSNGQGEFLRAGQSWKTSRVQRITPDTLVLAAGGVTQTLVLYPDPAIVDDPPAVEATQPNRGGFPSGGFPGGGFPGVQGGGRTPPFQIPERFRRRFGENVPSDDQIVIEEPLPAIITETQQ